GRNENLPLGAGLHQFQRLGPALDDGAGHLGGEGLAVLGAAVELGAVEERATVIDGDGVLGLGAVTAAFGDDLVLEAAGEGDDAGLVLVIGHERFAVLLVLVGELFHFLSLLEAEFLTELAEDLAHFLFGELGGAAGEGVLGSLGESLQVDVGIHPFKAHAGVHPDGIANFLLVFFQDRFVVSFLVLRPGAARQNPKSGNNQQRFS